LAKGDMTMKKVLSILVVLVVLSSGCSSSSNDYVDPLSELRSVCQELSLLAQQQAVVIGNGIQDNPGDDSYGKAFRDFYFSQPYLIDTFNNIINFQILTFINDIYINNEEMTINVANDEYVFESEDTITIDGGQENTGVQFTYNPERETWLFIGKRGGIVNGNPSEEEPRDVWIRQEGAIVNRTTYYVSTIFYYTEDSGGTKYTTSSILTYGTSEFPALQMAGQNESCQTYCISTDYTQIFSNGITSGWENWDDFKPYPTPGGVVDYEISVD
jgi:hypothetical protein